MSFHEGAWSVHSSAEWLNLILLIGALSLAGAVAAPAGGQPEQGTVKRLPVIDKDDIRFVRLSVGGEALNRWVSAITQDNHGFIWFATNDGALRYDGYTLVPYHHDPADPNTISEDNLRTIYCDRSGIVWIGTVSAGLDRFDPVRGVFTHFRHRAGDAGSLSHNGVPAFFRIVAVPCGLRPTAASTASILRAEPSVNTGTIRAIHTA